MEGQPDVEPRTGQQKERERERAEDEDRLETRWQRGQVRNTLHLVSAVAQWILLLACLIYLGIHFLQPSMPFVIMGSPLLSPVPGKSTKGAAMNLTAELGPIQIRNGSVVIPCDGLYLLSLESFIYREEEDLLKLTLQGTHSSRPLWE
ncbi:TNFL4 factor, partial [Origma solitaria]|nr:TNFL4 factor [Origma solitaria]